MHCYEEVEVWHATRRNKPARFTSLQVVQTANIQVIEGRDNGRRRPEMGPRQGSATSTLRGRGGREGTNFPGLI